VALKNQRPEPQIFYPIRDVARHFRVPPSTVARVYDHLEEEGILVSVRGSKTLLQGLSSGPGKNVSPKAKLSEPLQRSFWR
jgi:DNA-binding transcriptional regulator YhcF (GntR family)